VLRREPPREMMMVQSEFSLGENVFWKEYLERPM
jgi:hypothetical protein